MIHGGCQIDTPTYLDLQTFVLQRENKWGIDALLPQFGRLGVSLIAFIASINETQ